MNRVTGILNSRSSGIDALDLTRSNVWRVEQIDKTLLLENQEQALMWRILSTLRHGADVPGPYWQWIEDDILHPSTKVNYAAGYSSSATSIVVDDAAFAVVNTAIYVPRIGETMLVTAVNYSTNTLTVLRAANYLGGVGAALLDNDVLIALPARQAEMGEYNLGNQKIPGTPVGNWMSFFSGSVRISDLQEVTAMIDPMDGKGPVGKMTRARAEAWSTLMRMMNKELMFGQGGTYMHADGPIYSTYGVTHFIGTDNVLFVDRPQQPLSWPMLSNWFDSRPFNDDVSSGDITLWAGQQLYQSFTGMARDMSRPPERYWNPDLGVQEGMVITTETGNTVHVIRDKYGLSSREGLSNWGIGLDLKHIQYREVSGMPMQWIEGCQLPNVSYVQDAYRGAMGLEVHFPGCHCMLRTQTQPMFSDLNA